MNLSLDQLHTEMTRLLSRLASVPAPLPSATAPAVPDTLPGSRVESPVEPAPPAAPCQLVDRKTKGWDLDGKVTSDQLVPVAELLDRHGFAIDTVTGIDWLEAGEMEVVYDFYHQTASLRVVLRTRVSRSNPEVPTLSGIFPGANWHERETHEFFGILFLGHPNLSPLLLPEDATYHPLRKDFAGAA